MNINQGILMRAAGIGAGVGLLLAIVGNIPLAGIACCCVTPLAYLASGAVYGYLVDREGGEPDVASWAVGGAATSAAMLIAASIINVIAAIVRTVFNVGVSSATNLEQFSELGLPPEVAAAAAGGGAGIGIVIATSIGAIIFWSLVGAGIGAAFAAIKRNQGPKQPTEAPAV